MGHALPRLYPLFQQKIYTKHNTLSWQSANTAKTSCNFEKNYFRILIPDKFQEKSLNFMKFVWVTKKF